MDVNPKMENEKSHYFDRLGDDFERFMDDYDVTQRCTLIFSDLLKDISLDGKEVLEVGCGTGCISRQILSQKAELTALDIGENLVQRVSRELGCKGVVGDACRLPFETSSFDRVISSECIEHTPDPRRAIQEMCRVCRPGGTVCLTSPNKLWYPVLWFSLKMGIRKFKGIENWLFPRQARFIMEGAGLIDIRLSGCHLWPFQLKGTRPVLRHIDMSLGHRLYEIMINYGIRGTKA